MTHSESVIPVLSIDGECKFEPDMSRCVLVMASHACFIKSKWLCAKTTNLRTAIRRAPVVDGWQPMEGSTQKTHASTLIGPPPRRFSPRQAFCFVRISKQAVSWIAEGRMETTDSVVPSFTSDYPNHAPPSLRFLLDARGASNFWTRGRLARHLVFVALRAWRSLFQCM